ncbi:MAG: penicillin-binding protein [Bacteroidetes bacterium]|uniref:transglycosylase domain-containing protein n=1 Tax=Phnomibacter sp. TaxID=2836217 RepID=UPI002FDEE01B|nr:penicillin-binding protein [Bacteroidota bacterium]
MTRAVSLLWKATIGFLLLVVLLFVATNFGLLGKMPSIEDLQNPSASLASEVYADDGTPMGKFYLEDRSPVGFKDISPYVIKALVATEDERFYDHSGIDGKSLLRAVKGVVTFDPAGGASTISQQLALNLFGGQRATNKLTRGVQKIKEWIIAVKLERNFTKDEIITYYLNTVAFGDNVYGIRNAARTFFQKEPDRLELTEAAVLVGMLKANTTYNPRRNPKAALDRRNTVLDQMVRNNFLSDADASKLKREPIKLNYKKLDANSGIAPYFRENVVKDEVRKLLKDLVKSNGEKYDIYRDGLKIYTTINPHMQLYAEEAVAQNVAARQRVFKQYGFVKNGTVFNGRDKELEKFMKQSDRWRAQKEDGLTDEENRAVFNKPVQMKIFAWNAKRETDTTLSPLDSIKYLKTLLQSGFMAMEPQTGFVKAWVGGIDYKTFKIDHVNLNVKRQVGSTIKPMLYCQAIEEAGFSPETPLQNVQQNFPGYGLVPANGKGARGGSPPMAVALAQSLNGCAAYLMKQIGPQRFVDFLNRCQVQTKLDAYPSLALGSCDLSLYEMMWMYTMFPGRGFNTKPQFISRIEDRNGNVIVNVAPQIKEVISEVAAYNMCKMMGGAVKFGTATRMNAYGVKAEMGAKTGTTNDNTDAWFMVYTPELLTGTWVGCDENWIHFPSSSAEGYGGAAALPACGMFLQKVYNDRKLGYDNEAKFVKPAIDKNDINYDYFQNVNGPQSPDAEGEDMGNGNIDDYFGDGLDTNGLGQIGGESELPVNEQPKTNNKPKPDTGRKQQDPADKAPKAVLPAPVRKN